jgi:hypothetical protein
MRAVVCMMVLAIAHAVNAAPIDDALDQALDQARDDDRADAERVADGAPPPPNPAELAAVVGPPIGEVLAAAYAAAGLDHDPSQSWTRRTRLAGLVPWVTVRTGRDNTWEDGDPAVGHETTVEVRATWRLDRLAFDPSELRVATIEASRRRERRRIASRVIRAYFTWRRARAVAIASPRWASHADEAAAELDAMTDDWFGGALARTTQRVRIPDK